MDVDVILKRFETPDEVREMPLGRFEVVHPGGRTLGRATCQLGWQRSIHVGPTAGAERCAVEHVGLVLSGVVTAFWIVDLSLVGKVRPCLVLGVPTQGMAQG